ncbi:CocE/NonD family hydrolase [Cereibacter sphaeroides]|nr:CocE/NonD family hydrolase [Cereibacter sphaeroides]
MEIIDRDGITIPLPDGTRLSARIWRPAHGDKVPAILEYIPYRKRDNTLPRDETIHPWMAAQGYACLRVDIRGNGDSEGVFDDEYSPTELQDACDLIAWIAEQDWCSGSVGMMGKSWGGFNCLQTAFLQPPALKAVVSVCSTTDRFADDIHFKGGTLLGENFGWAALMLSYASRPADPLLRPDWREDFRRRVAELPHLADPWTSHQSRDAYWKHGSVCEDYSRMKAAVLSVGGWNDGYMNTPAHLVENIPGAKAIVGPWVHQYPHTAVPAPRIGFLTEMKTWWDRWLKGIENGADQWPNYRAYMLQSETPDACAAERKGYWVAEQMPSPNVAWQELGLGDGSLGNAAPFTAVVSTPQTLGASAGEYFPMGTSAEMAGDQRADDAHSLCFEQLQPEGLRLLGAARLKLTLSADQPFAFVCARLCDVAPDGSSTRIAHGLLNLHHRSDPPAPLVPGESVEVEVVLDQMAYEMAPGHTLRLALSNTYWPFVWPSPAKVALTVTGGALSLPVHNGAAGGWDFAAPEVPPRGRLKRLTEASESRKREIDLLTGEEKLIVTHDSGETENPDHGLITRDTMVEVWSIREGDPLSARCDVTWTQHFRRGDWSIDTRVDATQTGTLDQLKIDAKLIAHIKDGPEAPEIIERTFGASVARRHV